MNIYRPVKTNSFNQGWGENRAGIRINPATKKAVQPLDIITSVGEYPLGYVSLYNYYGFKGHNGYDLGSWHGEYTYHSGEYDGWMITSHDETGGLGVDIVSDEAILKCTEKGCRKTHYVKCRYWHGMEVLGFDGKLIKAGEVIMRADNTGASSGDHVHFMPLWCDKDGNTLHTDNGWKGAFDPTRYYTNRFICDELKMRTIALKMIDILNQLIFLMKQKVNKVGSALKLGKIL